MTNQTDSYPLKAGISRSKLDDFVKDILKDGTPAWVSHPEDYRSMVEEETAREFEESCDAVSGYRMEDQEDLTDADASLQNFKNVNTFIEVLRREGFQVKVYQDRPQTCGLYAIRPGYEQLGYQFVTSMQVPVMPEWGLLHEEEHGVANGEAAIGWRQVLFQLVLKGFATEQRVHEIFGEPTPHQRSNRYRRSMHAVRNGRVKDVR